MLQEQPCTGVRRIKEPVVYDLLTPSSDPANVCMNVNQRQRFCNYTACHHIQCSVWSYQMTHHKNLQFRPAASRFRLLGSFISPFGRSCCHYHSRASLSDGLSLTPQLPSPLCTNLHGYSWCAGSFLQLPSWQHLHLCMCYPALCIQHKKLLFWAHY